jgi:hypothetical protein
MTASSPIGDRPSPSRGRRPARRANPPDLSLTAALRGAAAPRLLEAAETWPDWTDRRTYADSLADPADWPTSIADVAFRPAPRVDLTPTRIYPTDGPVLPLADPEDGGVNP